MTFRKSTTKGKFKTRVVDTQPGLAQLLTDYQPQTGAEALFPGMRGRSPTLINVGIRPLILELLNDW